MILKPCYEILNFLHKQSEVTERFYTELWCNKDCIIITIVISTHSSNSDKK